MKYSLAIALLVGQIRADAIHDAINAITIDVPNNQIKDQAEKKARELEKEHHLREKAEDYEEEHHLNKKGKDFEKEHHIKDKADDAEDEKKRQAEEVERELKEKKDKVQEEMHDTADQVEDEAHDTVDHVEDKKQEVEDSAHDAIGHRDATISALKIQISEEGQERIESEAQDVEETWKKIEHSEPVENVGHSIEKLASTQEAHDLKMLDKAFHASPEGRELTSEVRDVKKTLEENIEETPNGIHISNEGLDDVADEVDDVREEFKKLEKSHWSKDYDNSFKALGETSEAHSLGENFEEFKESSEGQMLGQELHELKEAVHEHVKVSDVPEDWKDDLFLF